MSSKPINLTGLSFGRLTVTGRSETNYRGKPAWDCRCECGRIKPGIPGPSLKNGLTTSCGCYRRETSRASLAGKPCTVQIDVKDQRFGRLVARHRTDEKDHNSWVWFCDCDCGKTARVPLRALRSGHTASCGCSRSDGSRGVVRNAVVREAAHASKRLRYQTEPAFRLNEIMGTQIRNCLKKRAGAKKVGRTQSILGYTMAELETHLRATLSVLPGYTWEHFMTGDLELEHIIPLSAFNFQCETDHDFKLAWALTNLRLYPLIPNRVKGAKLSAPFQPSMAFGPGKVVTILSSLDRDKVDA